MESLPDLFQALSGMTLVFVVMGAVVGFIYPIWGKEDPLDRFYESWQLSAVGAAVGGFLWLAIEYLS